MRFKSAKKMYDESHEQQNRHDMSTYRDPYDRRVYKCC